jgi:hypothetical protein
MAAFAGQGQTLTGEQLQPELHLLLDHLQGDAAFDFPAMPYHKAETLRRMKHEFLSHYRPPIRQE